MLIYKATNIINNKCYIGQTIQSLIERMYGHKHESKKDKPKLYFHKSIHKYSWESFTWEILCQCDTQEELNEMEYHYIRQFHSHVSEWGYNLTLGFDNTTTGYKYTDNQKLTASINSSGVNNPMYGKAQSNEAKIKMSIKNRVYMTVKITPTQKLI